MSDQGREDPLYPFLFHPYFKSVVWGGRKFEDEFHMQLPDRTSPFGEAWTISDRADHNSIVSNGLLAGSTLHELIMKYGEMLLGPEWHGKTFPLLVKILDARGGLSLQVHPDEAASVRLGNGAESKTEIWYVLGADPGAKIFAGLSDSLSESDFWQNVTTPEIEKQLQTFPSHAGDAFFIRAGCVHAIGAGNLILEIQQNSDTTFRLSDWGRCDLNGKPRTLHLKESAQCIDFSRHYHPKVEQDDCPHARTVLARCRYFNMDKIRLNGMYSLSTTQDRSFHLVSAASASCTVAKGNDVLEIPHGMTCLIPASYGEYELRGRADVILTFIQKALY